MTMEILGPTYAVGHATAMLVFVTAMILKSLPVPFGNVSSHANRMMRSAIISEVLLATVGAIQLLVGWISELLSQALSSPYTPDQALNEIIAQTSLLTAGLIGLSIGISAIPFASSISHALSPIITVSMTALMLILSVKFVTGIIPMLWRIYSASIIIYAIPPSRNAGANLIGSILAVVTLIPFLAPSALVVQEILGTELAIDPIRQAFDEIRRDPLALAEFPVHVIELLGGIAATIIISLIAFPIGYFLLTGIVARHIASFLSEDDYSSPFSNLMAPWR